MNSLFDKYWFIEKQNKILWWINNKFLLLRWIIRHILRLKDIPLKKNIFELAPNYYTIEEDDETFTSDFRTHEKWSKRMYYGFYWLWYFFHICDFFLDKYIPELSFGFDTLTV